LVCTLLPGKRVVLTFHSGGYATSDAGRTAARWTLRGFVFRRFDLIIAVNEEIRALFERFGVSKSRLRIVAPYSDDPRVGDEADVSLPTVIEDFIASHAPVLATVGGLEPEYDVPIQLAMLSSLRETRPDAGLVIVGDGSIRKQIESAIAETGLSEHALLCGDTPHAITLEIIRRADVLLRTSKYDGDSIAVREAIALGTPVVATDNGMRPAGVRLFPASDLDALRQVVSEALTSGPTSVTVGEHNGIDAVIELYHELVR
jgi:glycosyltransferase involved in cell wall biosynthesis